MRRATVTVTRQRPPVHYRTAVVLTLVCFKDPAAALAIGSLVGLSAIEPLIVRETQPAYHGS